MSDEAQLNKVAANMNANTDLPLKLPVRSLTNTIFIIATCCLAPFLNTVALSSCNIALPHIGRDMGIQQGSLEWVTSAYALSSACFLLLCGRLADLYGRKLVFLSGAVWMSIFSLGCGFSQTPNQLFLLRGLQGVGSAACISAAVGILAQSFPPGPRLSMGFATFAAGAPFGGGVGFNVGALLMQSTSPGWRGVFHLNAGFAALTTLICLLSIDRDEPSAESDKRVDWTGAALVTTGLVLIMFVLGEGELAPKGWRTPYMIAFLILGIFLVLAFIFWEHFLARHTTRHPLVCLSIFTRARGRFTAILLIVFLEWCAFMSWMLWVQLYYQDYKNYTPIQTTLRLIPTTVVGLVLTLTAGAVIGWLPAIYFLVVGTVATGVASLLFAVIDVNAPYWAYAFPSAILTVWGADLIFPCGLLIVSRAALPHEKSVAGGIFSTFAQLGTSFGLSITTAVNNAVSRRETSRLGITLNAEGTNLPLEAQLKGYRAAQWTGFAFAMFALALSVLLFRDVGIIGGKGEIKLLEDEKSVSSQAEGTAAEMASY